MPTGEEITSREWLRARRRGLEVGGVARLLTILMMGFATVYLLSSVGYENGGSRGMIMGAVLGGVLSVLSP